MTTSVNPYEEAKHNAKTQRRRSGRKLIKPKKLDMLCNGMLIKFSQESLVTTFQVIDLFGMLLGEFNNIQDAMTFAQSFE